MWGFHDVDMNVISTCLDTIKCVKHQKKNIAYPNHSGCFFILLFIFCLFSTLAFMSFFLMWNGKCLSFLCYSILTPPSHLCLLYLIVYSKLYINIRTHDNRRHVPLIVTWISQTHRYLLTCMWCCCCRWSFRYACTWCEMCSISSVCVCS